MQIGAKSKALITSRSFPREIPVLRRFFERRFQPLSVGGYFSNQRESISWCPKSPFPSKTQNRPIARTSPLNSVPDGWPYGSMGSSIRARIYVPQLGAARAAGPKKKWRSSPGPAANPGHTRSYIHTQLCKPPKYSAFSFFFPKLCLILKNRFLA